MSTDREYERLQLQARACIQGLTVYAAKLAPRDGCTAKLQQIRSMVEQVASWYGLCGQTRAEYDSAMTQLLDPLDRLLRGELPAPAEFTLAHQAAISNCLSSYRDEMYAEQESVYDSDIRLCDTMAREAMALLMEDDPKWMQGAMETSEWSMISACIDGLLVYAGHMSERGGMNALQPLRRMAEELFCYHGLGGLEKPEDQIRLTQCLEPFDRLLRGESVAPVEFTRAHQAAIADGLDLYRRELIEEDEPVYEDSIRLCEEITQATAEYLSAIDTGLQSEAQSM